MRAGLLNRRVTFFQRTNTRNDFGEAVEGYSEIGSRWANIRYKTGREAEQSGQIAQIKTTIITVRKDSLTKTIQASGIVNCEGIQYQIQSITPDYRREHLEMIVEAV